MFNYRPRIKEICVAILSIFILQSCYSSTVVKGIPVRDLVYAPRMKIGDINDWIANTMPLLKFLFYPSDFEACYFDERFLVSPTP